jgi:hypothetical protein
MRSLVLQSLKSRRLCNLATLLLNGVRHQRSNDMALINAVDTHLRAHFVYVPEEIETIQEPEYMIVHREMHGVYYGDCDDISTLEAAILTCLGIPARFVCIRSKPDTTSYDHVYIEALVSNEWVVSDITVPKHTEHRWYQRLEIAI